MLTYTRTRTQLHEVWTHTHILSRQNILNHEINEVVSGQNMLKLEIDEVVTDTFIVNENVYFHTEHTSLRSLK